MSEHSRVTASAAQTPDWAHLRSEAIAASRRAYVPYSRFPVGVAALTTSGRVLTGCNVENAAYGVVLCAECGLVSSLLNTSERELFLFTRRIGCPGVTLIIFFLGDTALGACGRL